MRVLIGDGAEVAAAAPFSASISGDNEGSGTVAVRTNPAAAAIPAPAPSSFVIQAGAGNIRSEEHTSELQSLMRISYADFCLKKKNNTTSIHQIITITQS